MGSVFRSKEVYKKLKYDLHGRNEIVAVRGVYVSGEYRPPYYNDPILRIYEMSSQHATVVDFKTEEKNASTTDTGGFYKIGLSASTYNLTRYGKESKDVGTTDTGGLYKLGLSASTYDLHRYEKDYIDATSAETGGLYKLRLTSVGYVQTRYYVDKGNSTPEPTLRMTTLTSEDCTVTNYTP